MLSKSKLNITEVLISKYLIYSNISHYEFFLINNVLKEYNNMKEEIKGLKDFYKTFKDFKDLNSSLKVLVYL